MEISIKLILFGFLFIGFINLGISKSTATDSNEYDYDYEDQETPKSPNPSPQSISDGPVAVNLAKTTASQSVWEGSTVFLDCPTTSLKGKSSESQGIQIIWNNSTEDAVIPESVEPTDDVTNSHSRVHVFKNHTLQIINVTAHDAVTYLCVLLPLGTKMAYKLDVKTTPTAKILNNENDITGRTLTLAETREERDKGIEIVCQTTGNPEPIVKWYTSGVEITNGNDFLVDGNKLTIKHVGHNHAGSYQCTAENGKMGHATTTVNVLHRPVIMKHRHIVNTEVDSDADIQCLYNSNPIGEVTWSFNGATLVENSKYRITSDMHKKHHRSTLMVHRVADNDTGVYTCSVQNIHGNAVKNFELVYVPEPAVFHNFTRTENNEIHVFWTVRSKQKLVEVTLHYKRDDKHSKTWMKDTNTIINSEQHSGIWLIQHYLVIKPHRWITYIKSKNSVGWSSTSEPHIIDITGNSATKCCNSILIPLVFTLVVLLFKPFLNGL